MLRLGLNAFKEVLISEQQQHELFPKNIQNATEDFLRSVVWKCSEQIEFEVDGKNFRATCERIE